MHWARRLFSSAAFAALLLHTPGLAAADLNSGRRVALVIGNAAYQSIEKLDSAVSDATAIADTLRGMGFGVTLQADLNAAALESAVRFFIGVATGADAAVVYYAGHGVNCGGRNYLVPVDWNPLQPFRPTPLQLTELINRIQLQAKASIYFLDAGAPIRVLEERNPEQPTCPFSAGFSPQSVPQNVLLSIATSSDGRATPSDSRRGPSPYSAALLEELQTSASVSIFASGERQKGFIAQSLATRLSAKVPERTRGKLGTWTTSTLRTDLAVTGPVYLPRRVFFLDDTLSVDDSVRDWDYVTKNSPRTKALVEELAQAEAGARKAQSELTHFEPSVNRDAWKTGTDAERALAFENYDKAIQLTISKRKALYEDIGFPQAAYQPGQPYVGVTLSMFPADSPYGRPSVIAGKPAADLPYTAVDVFFGTDRKQGKDESRKTGLVVTFSNEFGDELKLGHAMVTVPKYGRDKGTISQPGWGDFDLISFKWKEADPAKHFAVFQSRTLTASELKDLVRIKLSASKRFKDQAFVFVHGYNTSLEDALMRTAQMTFDLEFDGAAFAYSWPSARCYLCYLDDSDSWLATRPNLRTFLEFVVKESGAKQVHLIAHSMGNWPLLEVLNDLAPPPAEGGGAPPFNQMILAAPDMDAVNFVRLTKLVGRYAKGTTLYASSNDLAFNFAERFRKSRVGDLSNEGVPIIVPRVYSIDVSEVSTSFFSTNHSIFAERRHVLRDIELMFENGKQPPKDRLPLYDEISTPLGKYWKYPKP